MSFLDVSDEMREEGVRITFGTGDLPDFYYTLDLGLGMVPYFVLPGVKADELVADLPPGHQLDGVGQYDTWASGWL